jgi:hypothetical protein
MPAAYGIHVKIAIFIFTLQKQKDGLMLLSNGI